MVKDPWPLLWTPYTNGILARKARQFYCMYCRRYTLPCATSRWKCRGCLIRQQNMSNLTNDYARSHGEPKVVHVCDRCGAEISDFGTLSYVEVTNREGGMLLTMELCKACTAQIAEWAGGVDIEMPEIPDELNSEDFWE